MQLKEIDSFYQNIISTLPVKERVKYCEQLIDSAQLTLIRNKKYLGEIIKVNLQNTIEAAQNEIRRLEKLE